MQHTAEQAEHIYNLRGYMSNAWPRVKYACKTPNEKYVR